MNRPYKNERRIYRCLPCVKGGGTPTGVTEGLLQGKRNIDNPSASHSFGTSAQGTPFGRLYTREAYACAVAARRGKLASKKVYLYVHYDRGNEEKGLIILFPT